LTKNRELLKDVTNDQVKPQVEASWIYNLHPSSFTVASLRKHAVPAVFLTATPSADSASSHPVTAVQSLQELCLYLLREMTFLMVVSFHVGNDAHTCNTNKEVGAKS
jgi:hypothetical protein